jgi:hypothetical protein
VLRVISSSLGGLEPVFAIPENALSICEAKFGMLLRYVDGSFVTQVMVGAPPALSDALLHKRSMQLWIERDEHRVGDVLRFTDAAHHRSLSEALLRPRPVRCAAGALRQFGADEPSSHSVHHDAVRDTSPFSLAYAAERHRGLLFCRLRPAGTLALPGPWH